MSNKCKGIDDLFAAGRTPQRLKGAEVSAFFERFRNNPSGSLVQGPLAEPSPVDWISSVRPQFPVDVFPTKVSRFAQAVTAAMGCPMDFIGMALLVVAGAAVGAARAFLVKGGYLEKGVLYGVIVSQPGTKKTAALKAAMKPIYAMQHRLYIEHTAARKAYEEALDEYQNGSKAAEGSSDDVRVRPIPPRPMQHLWANDTTVEGLGANLAENPKGVVLFRDELAAWVRSMDQYKGRGTDRQFFMSAWSSEEVKIDRKTAHGDPIIIPDPFVSVLGGIQPDMLTELQPEAHREDGFFHRILFAFPDDQLIPPWSKSEVTREDERDWQTVVNKLLNLQLAPSADDEEQPQALRFSPDGEAAYIAWHDALVATMNGPDFPPLMRGPCSKLLAYCARFALILHMLRVACEQAGDEHGEGEIDAVDVGHAIQLANYFQAHLGPVYGHLQQTPEDKQIKAMRTWMQRTGRKSTTARELQRNGVAGVKTASEGAKLIREAIDRGLGHHQADSAPSGGKCIFVLGGE